jgi:hypothetical protein
MFHTLQKSLCASEYYHGGRQRGNLLVPPTQWPPEERSNEKRKILIHGNLHPCFVIHKSPNPVLALDSRLVTLGSNLLLINTTQTRCLEEQTRVLAFL